MSVGISGSPSVDLVGDLDQQLRDVVRREGVDPQLETTRVRRLAEEVVRAHDERSLTGVVTPVPDPVGVVGELVARVSGFGPLQRFLDDPEVEEIWINDPSRVFIARNGRHELTNVILSRRRGPGAGRADAQVQRSPHRPVPAVRRCDVAGGPPAARRAGRDQSRVRGRERPQVRAQGRPAQRPGAAGLDADGSRAVPRSGGPRRAEHRGRRRNAGREDHDAELPRGSDPRWRPDHLRRGGLRAPFLPPRLGADADPAGRARGDRRGHPARSRSRDAPDAADAGSSSARCGRPSASTCCSP